MPGSNPTLLILLFYTIPNFFLLTKKICIYMLFLSYHSSPVEKQNKNMFLKNCKKIFFYSIFNIFLLLRDVAGAQTKILQSCHIRSMNPCQDFYSQLLPSSSFCISHFYGVKIRNAATLIPFLTKTATCIICFMQSQSQQLSGKRDQHDKIHQIQTLKNDFYRH